MKDFIWANIKSCTRCNTCDPRKWIYIGKTIEDCCGMKIINPNVKGLEFAKKIVMANKQYIYDNA